MSFLYEKFRFKKLSIEVSNKNQETKDFSVSLFNLLFCFIEVHGSINSLSFVTHVHGVLWSHVLWPTAVLANVAHFVTIVVPDRVMTCRVRYQVGSIYWLSKRAKSQARLNS